MVRFFVPLVLISASFVATACSSVVTGAPPVAPISGSVSGKPFDGVTALAFVSSSNPDGKIDRQTVLVFDGPATCSDVGDISSLAAGKRRLAVVVQGPTGSVSKVTTDDSLRSSVWLDVGTDKHPQSAYFQYGTVILERAATHATFGEKVTDPTNTGKIKIDVTNAGAPDDSISGEIEFTLCWLAPGERRVSAG